MTDTSIITRIDHDDPRCQEAVAAERRLFAHFGLDYQVHHVSLADPDLNLRVLTVGQGTPVLMVPGGTGDAVFYAGLMAELTGRRLIAINRPGGGMSDAIDHRRVDMRRLAVDTIRAVADAFELDQAPIVANSMGGLWSFWYTLAHPDRVTGLVQMGCPALILSTSAPFFMRLLSVPGIKDLVARTMQPQSSDRALEGLRFQGSSLEDIARMPAVGGEAAYRFFNLPTYLDSWKTLVPAAANLRGARPRYRLRAGELKGVKCPVQLIWGQNDPFGGLDVARQVAAILPNARLHEMPTGHLPFLDRPAETGQVVRAFLAEVSVAETGP